MNMELHALSANLSLQAANVGLKLLGAIAPWVGGDWLARRVVGLVRRGMVAPASTRAA